MPFTLLDLRIKLSLPLLGNDSIKYWVREVEGHPYSIIQWHCWKGRRALQKCFNVKWENLAWIIKECSFDQFCNIVWKSITLKNWNLNGKISLLLYPMIYVLYTSARSCSLFIKFEFHRVSNCRVWIWVKLNFCSSISSFGLHNMSFSGFFELEFSRNLVLRVKTCRVFRVLSS